MESQAHQITKQEPGRDSREHERLRGLDGIRAAAVTLVVLAHFVPARGNPVDNVVQKGGFGVEIFFVLSGFLITHLLIREEHASGRISLPWFYARRAIRILPPLLAFLMTLCIARAVGALEIPFLDLAACLLFVRNFVGSSPESAHLWTLAIEEQFYLLWPVFLVLVPSRAIRTTAVAGAVCLAPFWAHLVYKFADHTPVNTWRTDLRLLPILTGSLLALLRTSPRLGPLVRSPWSTGLWTLLAATTAMVCVVFTDLLSFTPFRFLATLISSTCVALIINYVISNGEAVLTRVLEFRPVAWIGVLSYSIYLWQQPFAPYVPGMSQAWFRRFPIGLCAAFACALSSYYLLERPLLGYRKRLRPGSDVPTSAGEFREIEVCNPRTEAPPGRLKRPGRNLSTP